MCAFAFVFTAEPFLGLDTKEVVGVRKRGMYCRRPFYEKVSAGQRWLSVGSFYGSRERRETRLEKQSQNIEFMVASTVVLMIFCFTYCEKVKLD